MAPHVTHVVADSAAFIRNAPLREISENIYTIPEVISESCDKATRSRFKTLPYEVKFKEPSSEALAIVSSFAKKTGDYSSLSAVDLKVLALTYDLEKQFKGTDHISQEPKSNVEWKVGGGVNASGVAFGKLCEQLKDGQTLPSNLITEEEEEPAESEQDGDTAKKEDLKSVDDSEQTDDMDVKEEDNEEEEEEDDDDSDEEGWITPQNIASVKRAMGVDTSNMDDVTCVGCLTTDFAMQNVLIQMNLSVISVDGLLIKQVKSYVLRCYGCFKITKDTSKTFCPHCGNKTLRKLSASINEDGTLRYHLARNYKINTRGTIFPLPKPTGGKYAQNPRLFEDQPFPQQRISRKAMQKFDVMSDDIVQASSPFKSNDVYSKSSQLGFLNQRTPYWAKRNPNEGNKRKKKK